MYIHTYLGRRCLTLPAVQTPSPIILHVPLFFFFFLFILFYFILLFISDFLVMYMIYSQSTLEYIPLPILPILPIYRYVLQIYHTIPPPIYIIFYIQVIASVYTHEIAITLVYIYISLNGPYFSRYSLDVLVQSAGQYQLEHHVLSQVEESILLRKARARASVCVCPQQKCMPNYILTSRSEGEPFRPISIRAPNQPLTHSLAALLCFA